MMRASLFVLCFVILNAQAGAVALQWHRVLDDGISAEPLGQVPPDNMARGAAPYAGLIAQTAQRYALDPLLLHAVVAAESGYQAGTVSNKGAIGLMQVMPATAARFGNYQLTEPGDNLDAGAAYLRLLMKRFDGRLDLVLASYNAGEGAVMRYGNTIPPYQETQHYVRRVLSNYDRLRQKGDIPLPDTSNVQEVQEKQVASRTSATSAGDNGLLWRFFTGGMREEQH